MVSMDLRSALSAAARERRPVRLTYNSGTNSYLVTSLVSGDTLKYRAFGPQAEVPVDGISISPSIVDIYPAGRTSGAVTLILSAGSSTRTVTMSSAGLVRVVD